MTGPGGHEAASGAGGCGCLREPRGKRGGQGLHDPQTHGGGRVSSMLVMAAQTLRPPGAGGRAGGRAADPSARAMVPAPASPVCRASPTPVAHVCGHVPSRL